LAITWYDKLMETHRTVVPVCTVLEESGSSHCCHCFGRIWKLTLFSPFWKNLEAHTVVTVLEESGSSQCCHCFGRIWKLTLLSLLWKNLEAHTVVTVLEESGSSHCFHYFLTVLFGCQSENSENNELPDSSRTVKTVKYSSVGLNHLIIDLELRITC